MALLCKRGCSLYFEHAHSSARVARKHTSAITSANKGPNCVDDALLVALQHFKTASGLRFPDSHRAVMRSRKNMAMIVTPGDGPNCVGVLLEYPQALAGLRIPEPNIAGA